MSSTAKTEIDYQLAQSDHRHNGDKQGHKCCGGCCDVRRAVIIVDIVYIYLAIYELFTAFSSWEYSTGYVFVYFGFSVSYTNC